MTTITLSTVLLLALIWLAIGKVNRKETKTTVETTLRASNKLIQTGLGTSVFVANAHASQVIADMEKDMATEKVKMLTSQDILAKAGL